MWMKLIKGVNLIKTDTNYYILTSRKYNFLRPLITETGTHSEVFTYLQGQPKERKRSSSDYGWYRLSISCVKTRDPIHPVCRLGKISGQPPL